MAISSVLGAARYVPASVIQKALGKLDPKFNNFFSRAIAYGFDADQLIEGLSDKFKSGSQKDYENQLAQGGANNTLRPDEMVSRSRMESRAAPGKALRSGLALAAGGLLGGGGSNQEQGQGSPEDQSEDASGMVQGQPQGKPQSPLSGQAMEQDIQAQNEQPGEFQDILNAIQSRMSRGGRSLEQAAQEVAMNDNFKPKVQRIEQSGIKFMDWVMRQLGGQQGPQGQGQQPQRNNRIQMMQKITQELGSLRR
jgi:hypothetical protein